MPMTLPFDLVGPLQMQVMRLLWSYGATHASCTVGALHIELNVKRAASGLAPLAYTTILTVTRNLARRGFVSQTKSANRSHLFVPLLTEDEYLTEATKLLLNQVFGGNHELMSKMVGLAVGNVAGPKGKK